MKKKIIFGLLIIFCIGIFSIFLVNLGEDIVNFDRENIDEVKVINANYISSYKNAIYIKLPIGNNAFSFGLIFIGSKNDDVYTVRHEYGHYLQYKELGIYKYTKYIAIPSLRGYWSGVSYYEYYSLPWEYGAELYGEVNRINYKYDDDVLYNYNKYMGAIKK